MAQAAKLTRENRTITVDFHDETTYFGLLGTPHAFVEFVLAFRLTKSAEKPRHSCRGWIGVGRAGLNAQEPNKTHAVPEPSMGEGTA